MSSRLQLLAVLLCTLASSAQAHSNGQGIDQACDNLMPGHPVAAQNSPSPYNISFTPSNYTPGVASTVNVTLSGNTDTFKGFLIVARRANLNLNQTSIGHFTPVNNTMQTCSGNALVHSSNEAKTNITFVWNLPSSVSGDIVFRVTFVKDVSTFWVNQLSSVLQDVTVLRKDPGCSRTKGCLSQCIDTNCFFTLNWQAASGHATFVLATTYKNNAGLYMAVGFSSDHEMGSDNILGCAYGSSGAKPFAAVTTGPIAPTIVNDTEVKLASWSIYNGIFTCTMTRPLAGDSNRNDLTKPYVIFFVTGPAAVNPSNGKITIENYTIHFMTNVIVNIATSIPDLVPLEMADLSGASPVAMSAMLLVMMTLITPVLL